ncbi:hypothetical protein ABID23_000715 [Bartonella silvatica]|uniref:Uncharacterized protein n=1 Tax=Bartonella silvatica TaxID=357760 RepID=A0ABV2HGF0_9HYPH
MPNKMTRILKEAVVRATENAGNTIGHDGLMLREHVLLLLLVDQHPNLRQLHV